MKRSINTIAAAYSAGFQSYVDGYSSIAGAPYNVYMDGDLRQAWLRGWSAAHDCQSATRLREAGFVARTS